MAGPEKRFAPVALHCDDDNLGRRQKDLVSPVELLAARDMMRLCCFSTIFFSLPDGHLVKCKHVSWPRRLYLGSALDTIHKPIQAQ